jgi:4-hydroxyphenylpyruvate dioxygenase
VSPLPAMPSPAGFNFVEIRAEESQRERVRTTLFQLGFDDAGNHHSKPVELWAQGGARVVINRGDASTASPTIAALGFDVTDPDVAAARAIRLLAGAGSRRRSVVGRSGPGLLRGVLRPGR